MSSDLKSILSEIKFPVRYDAYGQYIFDADNKLIAEVRGWGWIGRQKEGEKIQDAFGEELARLINTLDPNRESVSDEEIEKEAAQPQNAGTAVKKNHMPGAWHNRLVGFKKGARWTREQLSK